MTVLRGILTTWPGRLFAVALVALVAGGAVLASRVNAQPAKAELRTQAVTKGSVVQSVAVSGSVAAQSQTKMSFRSTGKIAAVYVSVGQQVTAGQPLAKLDTTDLEAAVAQAESNLRSAQTSYDRTVASAGDAQRSLDQAQQSTQTDIANAQQAVTKLKTNYANARNTALSVGTALFTDITGYQSALDALKTGIDVESNDLANALRDPAVGLNQQNDVRSAQTSINGMYGPLATSQNLSASSLKPAIDDFQRALDGIGAAVAEFDAALAADADTSRSATDFQSAMFSYNLASGRLTTALDSVNAQLNTMSTSTVSAQASLNTVNTRTNTALDRSRTDLSSLLSAVTGDQQTATSIKAKITQGGTALSTMSDAIGGSIANAIANVDTVKQRSAQTIQSAQTSVAQQPYNIAGARSSVDNAATALQNAQTNLDNAVVTAPSAGVVASIVSQVGESAASPFMTLANTSAMVLHGTVGESDVAKLKLGLVANVTVDAVGATSRMTGKVTSLDPVATIQQGVPVYGVDVTIDLPQQAVKPGMTGTANVVIASKQGVLTVPNLAIRSTGGRRYVQVLKDGEAVDTDVTFGIANDTVTEVASGLSEGDLVVLPAARATGSANTRGGAGGFGGGGGPVIVGR